MVRNITGPGRLAVALRHILLGSALIGTCWSAACSAPKRSEHHNVQAVSQNIMLFDFEGAAYPKGWTTTGTAFGNGPAHGKLPNQMDVSGFEGHGLVNSYLGGDTSVGTLTSTAFPITRKYISFLIGGGRHPDTERVELVIDGKVVRSATGPDSERLLPDQWDVSELAGKLATIKITDAATGGWGHINIDSIMLTNTKIPDERTSELASAMTAIRSAVPVADSDPRRPAYHFHTPAQWMNDPNGPIYYNGWYHVFYQFNPYGTQWGNMNWGHARSKDLVNWEHMPVAIWPSKREGEDHVYSGSVFQRADGKPVAFYTSIGSRDPEQWAATPDTPELALWSKVTANPVVSNKNHGEQHVVEWRDPFLFTENHATYMVTGGGLNDRGVVTLYRAIDKDLTSWKYLGVVFEHPDKAIHNVECPNMAKIDGKWVLLTSTYGKVESFVGQLDVEKVRFTTEKRGVLTDGSYASQLMHDAAGNVVHLAWVHTESGTGWNGYMTLPSTLRILADGTLTRQPIPQFTKQRDKHVQIAGRAVNGTDDLSGQVTGDSFEMIADIDPGTATSVAFKLRASADGKRAVTVRYEPATRTLFMQDKPPVVLPESGNNLKLRLFVDKGALDIYTADGAVTLAGFFPDAQTGDTGIQIVTEGGTANIKQMDIYSMKSAEFDMTHLH